MRDELDEAVVRNVIQLAHDLGMTSVAEGVETFEAIVLAIAVRGSASKWPQPAPHSSSKAIHLSKERTMTLSA